MTTVYISIGNSDDKLSQSVWATFYRDVDEQIRQYASKVHGAWVSLPNSPWQNACWCVEFDSRNLKRAMKDRLIDFAAKYNQDSIAWAEAKTEFLRGGTD